jgi:hypothetical protein
VLLCSVSFKTLLRRVEPLTGGLEHATVTTVKVAAAGVVMRSRSLCGVLRIRLLSGINSQSLRDMVKEEC